MRSFATRSGFARLAVAAATLFVLTSCGVSMPRVSGDVSDWVNRISQLSGFVASAESIAAPLCGKRAVDGTWSGGKPLPWCSDFRVYVDGAHRFLDQMERLKGDLAKSSRTDSERRGWTIEQLEVYEAQVSAELQQAEDVRVAGAEPTGGE